MVSTPRSSDWNEYGREADNVEVVLTRVRNPADQTHTITNISASFDTTVSSLLDLYGLSKVGPLDLSDTAVLDLVANTFTKSGHGLSDGDKVVYDVNGGGAVTGITSGAALFVRGVSGDDFELSLTSGGAAIDVSGTQPGFATEAVILPLSKSWQVYDHIELDFSAPLEGVPNAPLYLRMLEQAGIQAILNMSGYSS